MIRYSIHKHPYWHRWYVTAHFPRPVRAAAYRGLVSNSCCAWFDTWDDAVGYIKSIFGWQW